MSKIGKNREKLFSVTKSSCILKYYKGEGGGGQKKNKTENCCQCTHKESKAQACSEEGRSKDYNTRNAFKKMTQTKQFKNWVRLEASRKTGELKKIEEKVDKEMTNIKVECKESGLWKKERKAV